MLRHQVISIPKHPEMKNENGSENSSWPIMFGIAVHPGKQCSLGIHGQLQRSRKRSPWLFDEVSIVHKALKRFDRVLQSRQTRHNIFETVNSGVLEDAFATIQSGGATCTDVEVRSLTFTSNESGVTRTKLQEALRPHQGPDFDAMKFPVRRLKSLLQVDCR